MLCRYATYFFLVFLLGCAENSTEKLDDGGQVVVVCTTGMVADLAQRIGGDRVRVMGLMGPGVDPHYYKASQGDLAKLERADLILYNGLLLEGKMQDIFGKMARAKRIVAVAEAIDKSDLLQPAELEGHYDPHIWFDPALWTTSVALAADSIAVLLDIKADYNDKLESYTSELSNISMEWEAKLAEIPDSSRILITSHDAFWYMGRAFNIEVKALQGISTVTEAGARDVVDLVNFIVDRKVKTIFFESSVPKERLSAVLDGVRAKGHQVSFGGMLFSDALGDSSQNAETLAKVYMHNLKVIHDGLH